MCPAGAETREPCCKVRLGPKMRREEKRQLIEMGIPSRVQNTRGQALCELGTLESTQMSPP